MAAISTSPEENLRFSCIFEAMGLAFSGGVRYSPHGSSFFAQNRRRVDEEIQRWSRVSRGGKKKQEDRQTRWQPSHSARPRLLRTSQRSSARRRSRWRPFSRNSTSSR